MKKICLIPLFFFLTLIFGCKKSTVAPTQAELNATTIQNVMHQDGIHRVLITQSGDQFPDSFNSTDGVDYKFSNGFLTVEGYNNTYNLEFLKSYEVTNVSVSGVGSVEAIVLTF